MEIKTFGILAFGGFIGHLFLRTSSNWLSLFMTGKWHSHVSMPLMRNKGEAATGTTEEVKFDDKQQKAVDSIVQDRLARERSKYGDYDDLKKFKTEYEKSQEQKSQEDLVKAKKYEEAENGYKTKINEYGQKLTLKDQEIQNLKIDHNLTNEISRQNGFVEESIALLRGQVALDANGNLSIKGKDANGVDISMPLVDGVKKFYEQRPHLVKSTHKQGAGTGAGTGTGGGTETGGGQGDDLSTLNAKLQEANRGTDLKLRSELKQKIEAAMAAKGIQR